MTEGFSHPNAHSFIIRAWLEPRQGRAPAEWRWHVLEVQTGKQAYFHDAGKVLEYLGALSGITVALEDNRGDR